MQDPTPGGADWGEGMSDFVKSNSCHTVVNIVPILMQTIIQIGLDFMQEKQKGFTFLFTFWDLLQVYTSRGEGGVIHPVFSVGFTATDSVLTSFKFICLSSAAVLAIQLKK